ncbi:MAG: nucleotidyl transferase AbiEii/AbiGii toxin family protein [Deltaproteobacteria bacterium]|nr:nucleotidyl transferase AbiEii/AbiGii toxin family protein [Deltaproteobacteria bacterium]
MVPIIHSSPSLHDHWLQYLLHIARGVTSDFGDLLVLKGGTALKLCYDLPRI